MRGKNSTQPNKFDPWTHPLVKQSRSWSPSLSTSKGHTKQFASRPVVARIFFQPKKI